MNTGKIVGALAALAATAGLVYAFVDVPEVIEYGKQQLNSLEDVLLEAGIWGPVIIFCIYMVTTVFMLPLWGFHMTCGYVYGTFWAALLIATTQALCAGAAFSTSRYLVGPYIRNSLEKRYGRKFTAIDKAVGEDGLRITLLLRLSPIIPFGINNYLCGCTGMKVSEFVIGTWLGVLPGTTAYCNMGSMGKQVLAQGTTTLQKIVMGLGLVAALLVIKLLSDLATKALKDAGIGDAEETKDNKKEK
mmetsp:Transcript_4496/g.5211  ORF Transcript_4496/g.5211 Transcript_4496/m.5211 type:complete len:246 (+) Transcript_4496:139-876(+)